MTSPAPRPAPPRLTLLLLLLTLSQLAPNEATSLELDRRLQSSPTGGSGTSTCCGVFGTGDAAITPLQGAVGSVSNLTSISSTSLAQVRNTHLPLPPGWGGNGGIRAAGV